MLLYHFPLNTQENIANFTNKGIKTTDVAVGNGFVKQNDGKISNLSAYCNQSSYGCMRIDNLSGYDNMSIAFRIKLAGTEDRYQSLLWSEVTPNSSDSTRIYIQASANSSSCSFHLPNTALSNKILYPSVWYDIVLIKNNSTFSFYINGEYYGNATNQNYNISTLFFGNRAIGSAGKFTKGMFQDIRIYDHALSQAEINEYSRAMVVHYPLQGNELNQSVLKDVSGFGNDMQRYGGSSSYDNNSPRADKSLHLVNANHCYYQGNMKWSDFTNFTISVWIYSTNNSNYRGAIGMYATVSGANRGVAFAQWQEGTFRFTIFSGTATAAIRFTPISLNLNSWYFFSVTYDGNIGKLYMNGNIKEELTKAVEPLLDQPISLGRAYNDINRNWDGNISDVRIYATALSAEDIKNLYNSPIAVSKQHQSLAFEFKENPLYPSKYWRTPTYAEMNYILNTRTNAANLRTLGRVDLGGGTYRNGLFLLPDGFTAPSWITVTITTANYTTNSYTLAQFKQLESVGVVFMPVNGRRIGTSILLPENFHIWSGTKVVNQANYAWNMMYNANQLNITQEWQDRLRGEGVRLIHNGTHFSTSATTKIDFAPANLQYHCTQHIWRFAQHSYDIIGADNANISDSYNGWIDLFGYGTSGVNYSPTLHTTTNSDYASGNIANTDNDWGINEIQSYDYNVKNFAANKNGIVQHNELIEGSADGCYNNKLITNKLIER